MESRWVKVECPTQDARLISVEEGVAERSREPTTDTEVYRCGQLCASEVLTELCVREQTEGDVVIQDVVLDTGIERCGKTRGVAALRRHHVSLVAVAELCVAGGEVEALIRETCHTLGIYSVVSVPFEEADIVGSYRNFEVVVQESEFKSQIQAKSPILEALQAIHRVLVHQILDCQVVANSTNRVV